MTKPLIELCVEGIDGFLQRLRRRQRVAVTGRDQRRVLTHDVASIRRVGGMRGRVQQGQ